MPAKRPQSCKWLSEREAFTAFATHTGKIESAGHIKPLHWYVASRLVVEGGFNPDWITPRPPFKLAPKGKKTERRYSLVYDPMVATGGEQTILGGLKTKNVDVVVSVPGIGPVLAVSCKGVTKAFRNLTNRMEETIGECTNLHITYPALVVGYFAVLRANRDLEDAAEAPILDEAEDAAAETPESKQEAASMLEDAEHSDETPKETAGSVARSSKNDLAFGPAGDVTEGIARFHAALSEMTGRRGIRDEISRYEAMTTVLVEPKGPNAGAASEFPPVSSALHLSRFFSTLYQRYEERFVYGAPVLSGQTARYFWDAESPAFNTEADTDGVPQLDYPRRLGSE